MNAVSRHAKVKVSLKFADRQFVSGEHVAGKMELECKTDNNLAIGIIMVELLASEGIVLLYSYEIHGVADGLFARTVISRSLCCADVST